MPLPPQRSHLLSARRHGGRRILPRGVRWTYRGTHATPALVTNEQHKLSPCLTVSDKTDQAVPILRTVDHCRRLQPQVSGG